MIFFVISTLFSDQIHVHQAVSPAILIQWPDWRGNIYFSVPGVPESIPGSSLSPLWKWPLSEWMCARSFLSDLFSPSWCPCWLTSSFFFFLLGLKSEHPLFWPVMSLISSGTFGDTCLYPVLYLCPTFHGSCHSKITRVPQEGSMSVLFCIVMLPCTLAGI